REHFPIDQIVEEMVPLFSNSVSEEFLQKLEDHFQLAEICAFAGFPLIVEGNVVGVLTAYCPGIISEAVFKDLAPLTDTMAQYIQGKRGEEKLHEQEQQYRSIFEA